MPSFPLNIFLPAAGLGERLRPVTSHVPKPLLPILGKPIIEGILERLTAVCAGDIGINLHWKPGMLRSWAASSPWAERITFFPEDPILGTGGALKNASALLSRGPFIVHNADILLNIDFSRLIEEHLRSGNLATLVCHRLPELSNVVIDDSGQILDVENPGKSRPDPATTASKVAYTGVAVYSPEVLQFLPEGVSHATVAWVAASHAGHRVRAYDVTGASWNDVGSPATYARGVLDALFEQGETVYRSPEAACGDIDGRGYLALERGCAVDDGAALRNCIIMPGAKVAGAHANAIVGPDYALPLHETDMQPGSHADEQKSVRLTDPLFSRMYGRAGAETAIRAIDEVDALLIGMGGSDRRYFRVSNGTATSVLMECRPNDPDFERHLVYTRFFASQGVPVPALLAVDDASRRAVFEDLDDTSLFSYLKLPRTGEAVEAIYRAVLDIAVRFHTTATDRVYECPLLRARVFDYDYLRWETTYFLERFATGLQGIAIRDQEALDAELDRLAKKVDAYPKCVIHRDFQSQNIMILHRTPRVIDFQGARMAPPAYDIASMLWDPYSRLADDVRERLVHYYAGEMTRRSGGTFDERLFLESLLPCRLQRHMQALGAYGFLSTVKGKKYFLKHVPEALRMLKEEASAAAHEYPKLNQLIQALSCSPGA